MPTLPESPAKGRTFPPAKTVVIPQATYLPDQVWFTPGDPGAAVVTGPVWGAGGNLTTQVVSLAPGSVPVPFPVAKQYPARRAVSPDLKWLAVVPDARGLGTSVSVLLESVADGKRTGTFQPYKGYFGGKDPHLVDFAFVGPDRLLTIGSTGGLDVWDVPKLTRRLGVPGELKPDTTTDIALHRELPNPKNFAFSSGGRSLAVFDGAGFGIFDPATARRAGKTEPFAKGLTLLAGAALRADGSRLAAMYHQSNGPKPEDVVAVWDAKTGATVSDNRSSYKFASNPTGIQWWGPDLLVFWKYSGEMKGADVWSVADGRVVGKVQCGPRCRFAFGGPGDLLWAAVAGMKAGDDAALLAVEPPQFTTNETFYLTSDGLSTVHPGYQ